jgi:hypothetical protein
VGLARPQLEDRWLREGHVGDAVRLLCLDEGGGGAGTSRKEGRGLWQQQQHLLEEEGGRPGGAAGVGAGAAHLAGIVAGVVLDVLEPAVGLLARVGELEGVVVKAVGGV